MSRSARSDLSASSSAVRLQLKSMARLARPVTWHNEAGVLRWNVEVRLEQLVCPRPSCSLDVLAKPDSGLVLEEL